MTDFKKHLLDLVFPPRCVSCNSRGAFLCENCMASVKRVALPICEICGRPVRNGRLCVGCLGTPPAIDGVRSVAIFGGVIRDAVHALKYRGISALAPELAAMMYDHLLHFPLPVDVLVPVPLHEKRLKERGFNQSSLLARELGKMAGVKVAENCLVRIKYSSPQVRSSIEERKGNVLDSFKCLDRSLEGRRILLIDDVCTTRSTLEACSRPLKEIGSRSIWGFTLATEG